MTQSALLPPNGNNISRRSPEQGEGRRYWMDEEEEDGIYSIFLKRIRYASPGGSVSSSFSTFDTSMAGGVSYLEWQTIKVRTLKAGTLDRILHCLITPDHELDSSHVNIFLDTYREISNPVDVTEALLAHLAAARQADCPRQKPLRQLLTTLLDNYPEDFTSGSRVELDDSIVLMLEYSEKHQDIDFRHKLIRRIAALNAVPRLPHLEVLEWMQADRSATADQPGEFSSAEDLLNYSDKVVAEQLTLLDAELLRRLRPHECLARERASRKTPDTVQGTICHFNAVCARVESTLLGDLEMPASLRLRLLIKWIDVAQFLLMLRNFSSLNAVISALQAEPVFRLERLWGSLPADKMAKFQELAGVFKTDWSGNRFECQQGVTPASLRSYVGTMKEPTTLKNAKRIGHRRSHSDNPGTIHGMIPYLGKYLTDLVMLDTALPNEITSKAGARLLNFEKCRKEFEILAQIRLSQSAAGTYLIEPHDHFRFWFYKTLRVLDSEDCFANSSVIEPPLTSSCSETSDSSDQTRKQRNVLLTGLHNIRRMVSHENLLNHASLSIARKNSISSSQSLDYRRATSATTSAEEANARSPYLADTFCILKISLDGNCGTSVFYSGVNMYKSILVNDSEKTQSVIRSALEKHAKEFDDPNCYDLVQVLSEDKEFVIPFDATVFYAISSSERELKFTLRKKTSPLTFSQSTLPKRSTSKPRSPKETLQKWSIKNLSRI